MIRRIGPAAGALLLLCACNPAAPQRAPSPSPSASASGGPSLHISGHGTAAHPLRFVGQRNNRVQYVLLADTFESSGPNGRSIATFSNARMTFYDKNGSTLQAAAPQAILDQTQ
ncbi:MAG TPA: hypothetical protein VMH02_07275, partial [Verrucomicrobiae bacterium]|nr:hypothetical protein [Verrucomicrobiae bacterium]